jgi:hypothetical protein
MQRIPIDQAGRDLQKHNFGLDVLNTEKLGVEFSSDHGQLLVFSCAAVFR